MKILVVAPYPPRRCGIGVYARDQVAGLRAEGHSVTVLSPPDGDGDLRAEFPGGWAFVKAALVTGRFDRVLVHFQPGLYYRPHRPLSKVVTSSAFLLLALTRGPRLDVLVHEADPPELWRPDYFLLRLVLRLAGRVSFHTHAERDALERDYRVRVRGEIVPHHVSPAAARPPTRAEARTRLGIEESETVFVCAGFLQPSKGFDRAVAAFAQTRAGRNGDRPARLYVVGSVRERTPENVAYARALRDRCETTPRAEFVERYLGDEEFDQWLAAADWLVLPYRRSWSSGVLARAHALGTRAMVGKVGGLGEQAGERDVVFEDDEELTRAMQERVDD